MESLVGHKDDASHAYSIYNYEHSNSGIPSTKTNPITRTFPPLFMIKISEEEKIVEDLQEIESMQLIVQVIMVIVCIPVAFIVFYYCCKKSRHTVRCNLAMHYSVTPFVIRQPIHRPRLLERVYKPMRTPH